MSDLAGEQITAVLGGRPARSYPALLSTAAEAMAWARAGAASGAVVVADYQAAPRGRGGLPWVVVAGRGLGFSMVLRPRLSTEREGWPYVAASLAIAEVLDQEARLDWPDTVIAGNQVLASLGIHAELGATGIDWLAITALIAAAEPPRAVLLARLLMALEQRVVDDVDDAKTVLASYIPRCRTIGQYRRARLIPMGPGGPEITGQAVDVLADGSLVLLTRRGSRVAVPPQNLGLLETPDAGSQLPEQIRRRLHITTSDNPGHDDS